MALTQTPVAVGVGAPLGRPGRHMRQLHPQDGRLQGVEPKIAAEHGVVVFAGSTVDTQAAQLLGQPLIVGDDHPAVAKGAQVFAGKKRKTAHYSARARESAVGVCRANRLSGVLNDRNAVRCSQARHLRQIDTPTVEVDRDDGLCPGAQFGRNCAEVDIEGLGVDIDKHRSGAEPGNDTGGGEKRKRCGHHLVAVSDTERHQAGQQGVGAGRHADPEAGAAEGGDFLLKAADLGTEDEVL